MRSDLAAFAVGDVADDALDRLAAHVEQCADCQDHLAQLDDAADELVDRLHGLSDVANGPAAVPETLLTAARAALHQGSTTSPGSSELIVDAGRRIAINSTNGSSARIG